MIASDFLIENASYEGDLDALRLVRETVFVQEQMVPVELEWDELDPLSHHVLARDLTGQPIGTARLTPERKIGRMAVMADWRGRGVGAAMLQTLIERARTLHYESVSLNAQVSALGFYARFGFEPYGDHFDEAGIQHQAMRRHLQPTEQPDYPGAAPSPEPEVLDCDHFDGLYDASLRLIEQARRRLWIYTRDLEPAILGRPALLDALKRLALRAEEDGIRILIQSPVAARQAVHPLIPLTQKLSSTFSLRQPQDDTDLQYPSAFMLNDRGGYLFRPLASRLETSGSTHAPSRQKPLQDYFTQVWERSALCAELRQLRL